MKLVMFISWNYQFFVHFCLFVCLQGLLFATPECLKAPVDLVRLWMHEADRVYGDKLIEQKDMDNFAKHLKDYAKKYFEVST